MIRQILYFVVPMMVPFGMYAVYLWQLRRRGGTESWRTAPLTWLFIAGFILVILSFLITRFWTESPRDMDYRPPTYQDGRVVPAGPRAPGEPVIPEPGRPPQD